MFCFVRRCCVLVLLVGVVGVCRCGSCALLLSVVRCCCWPLLLSLGVACCCCSSSWFVVGCCVALSVFAVC